jgi:hypothetical protein
MNFLEKRTSWANKELGLFKVCLVALGAAAGTYFHEQLQEFILPLLLIFITVGAYLFFLWYKQLRK